MFLLIYQHLRHKWLHTFLCLMLLVLSTAMMTVGNQVQNEIETQQKRNLADIDLVVGAKGSPLQLVLCNLFHLDFPTGNIPLVEAQRLSRLPAVQKAHFLSLGDSYASYRIVGCDSSYKMLYKVGIVQGRSDQAAMEVVLGATVAKTTGLRVGDTFHGAHGLGEAEEVHETNQYKVVGIASATYTVADGLIFTPLESIWQVHEQAPTDSARQITAVLLTFKGAMGAMTVPRMINEQTALQAASPAFEVLRLNELMGNGFRLVSQFSYFFLGLSGLSLFIFLYLSLQERQYDLAILRIMGASRAYTFHLTWLEGVILSIIGSVLGIMMGHFVLFLLAQQLATTWHYPLNWAEWRIEELYFIVLNAIIAFLAAVIPAIRAYRIDLSKQLQSA